MDTFHVTAKLWPGGADLDLGDDTNNVTVPSSFNRHAANFVTTMDGTSNYQFLFWNTGRHLTNKRHVTWNFSAGAWGLWTATKWYGTSGENGGPARVRADGFTIGGNEPLGPDTPIDGPASTFPAGAWPFNGDDHAIGTADGAVDVVAEDPFHSLQFAGWLRMTWGGDDSGVFVETDTGASPGSSTFFEHSSGPYHADQGSSHDLLATYGNQQGRFVVPSFDWREFLVDLGFGSGDPIGPGDPGPDDFIRLAVLERLLRRTQPAGQGAVDFQRLIRDAQSMSAEELTRAKASLQTSLDLGKTALGTIEGQIKRRVDG
jgi:hypothetical protein